MAVTLNTTVAGGSGGSGSGDTLTAQTSRKRILRPFFEAYRAKMMALYPPVANTGTVVYIDPTVAGPGSGTFADPYKNYPSFTNNYTYLQKERTYWLQTTFTLTNISQTGLVFGTYSALDGSRVFEPERLATIDGGTVHYTAMRWTGTSGTFALSGLRIIGGGAGSTMIQFLANTAGTGVVTVEHCVFDKMGNYGLSGGYLNNQAINVGPARLIARFNRVCVLGDGIAASPQGLGYDILCNDVTTPALTAASGPDCIQIARSGATATGRGNVRGNWLDQAATTKQAFIVSGGTPQSSGEEVIFAANFVFGTDPDVSPGLPPPGGGSIAYLNDSASPAWVVGNYFDQFCGWASIPSNSLIAYNIGVRDSASTQWMNGFEIRSGSTGAVVANNTAINLRPMSSPTSNATNGFFGFVSAGVFVNNVCVNMGFVLAAGNVESYTLFEGCGPVNATYSPLALGTGSAIVSDMMLDPVGRPLTGSSPAAAYASAVTWNNSPLRMGDIFGQTSWDTLSNYGGAQG